MAAAPLLRAGLLLAALAAAAAAVDCVQRPAAAACAKFKLPNATAVADLNALCSAMHFMTGCSLYKACNATSRANVGADPLLCEPFQQLATICAHDAGMGGMAGCRAHYNGLCANGSRVAQCRASPGFGNLMTTQDANKWVRSICEEMDMEGCERCTPAWQEGKTWGGPNCDPFAVYGWLCVQMPDMWQCIGEDRWSAMCARDPTLYVCVGDAPALTDRGWWRPSGGGGGGTPEGGGGTPPGGGGGGFTPGPAMKMYFFNQMPFWLLFKEWTPATTRELAGAWVAIFFMGIVYELLQTVKFRVEAGWLAADAARGAAATSPAPELAGLSFDRACDCGPDGAPLPLDGPGAAKGAAGGGGGPRPLGEGAEGGGCCSGSRNGGGSDLAALTVPLAVEVRHASFDQEAPPDAAAGAKHHAGNGVDNGVGAGGKRAPPPRAGAAAAWVASARRAGSPLDAALLRRDAARAAMTFVTTGLSYLLMLAAMSFHVAMFFAVVTGIAVGTGLFGRFRSYVAVAHQERCCG